MDSRVLLKNGTVLNFPGLSCVITEYIGRGSNGIVYKGEYTDSTNTDSKHTVLIKELFPFDPSGNIYRDTSGRITVTPEASELYAMHRESFEYGNKVHLKLLQLHPEKNGANINTYLCNNTEYTLLGYTGGKSLDSLLSSNKSDYNLKRLCNRFLQLLDSLEAFHDCGYLHLDISPDNILIVGSGENEQVMLIDYNSVHPIDPRCPSTPVYYSTKPGYTCPECRHGDGVSTASDLYSVAAVFFRCLNGAPLTPNQMLKRLPPDVSDSAYLKAQPSSVADMVRTILKRGLAVLPKLRYKSIAEMRSDLKELSDRIDGIGITHWSLWETGRSSIIKTVNDNKSYEFIKNTSLMYPSFLMTDTGERLSARTAICEKSAETSFYITGDGGMGKTTSLLSTLYNSNSKYSSASPAFIYVSLFGWDGSNNYIHDRILENLRFKSDTRTYDAARHRLNEILKKPICSSSGTKPSVIILLDGLNEADGNTEALNKEISELAAFDGTRLIITSRNAGKNTGFPVYRMLSLSHNDVEAALSSKGLIVSESDEVKELLCIPMMLSIYIQTAENCQKQLNITTREQLLELYVKSLCDKEIHSYDGESQKKWSVEAAVYYVLPALAERMLLKNASLENTELFKEVKKCYSVIRSRTLSSAFPQWIGHTDDILGGAKNADKYYGDTVDKLLWGKMGLLTVDSNGKYKICHLLVAEFLAAKNAANQKRIFARKTARAGISAVCALLCLSTIVGSIYFAFPDIAVTSVINRFRATDTKTAAGIINYADSAYSLCGNIYELAYNVLELTDNNKLMEQSLGSLKRHGLEPADTLGTSLSESLGTLLDKNKVIIMPWSFSPLDTEYLTRLVSYPPGYSDKYAEYFSYLELAIERGENEYVTLLKRSLDADAKYVAALFEYVAIRHISHMDSDSVEYKTTESALASLKRQENIRKALVIEFDRSTSDSEHKILIASLYNDVSSCEAELLRYLSKYRRLSQN